jgi:hypothetical protein
MTILFIVKIIIKELLRVSWLNKLKASNKFLWDNIISLI